MHLTPQDFVSKWKRVTAREKQTHQKYVIDRPDAKIVIVTENSVT
jgi:hypothetical protein